MPSARVRAARCRMASRTGSAKVEEVATRVSERIRPGSRTATVCDHAAERDADQVNRPGMEMPRHLGDGERESLERGCRAQGRGESMTRQVEGDDVVGTAELQELVIPHGEIETQAMEEHEGRAASGSGADQVDVQVTSDRLCRHRRLLQLIAR